MTTRKSVRLMAALLALVLVIGALPVFAASPYDGLEIANFESASGYSLNVTGRSITVFVPYSQAASINLSAVISAQAKPTVAMGGKTYSVKINSNGFESSRTVNVGAAAAVSVGYTLTDLSNSAKQTGTTTYSVYVVKSSSFSSVTAEMTLSSGVVPSTTVYANQFGTDRATNQNCAYIELSSGTVPAYMSITAASSAYVVGSAVKARALTFSLNTTAISALECNKPVSFAAKAYDESGKLIGEGVLLVNVVSNAEPIELSVGAGQISTVQPAEYLTNRQIAATEVMFTSLPTAAQGTITVNGAAVRAGAKYPAGALTFKPGANYRGTVNVGYRAYDNSGYYFANTITYKVESYSGVVIKKSAMVAGTLQLPRPATVTAEEIRSACTSSSLFALEYVQFTSVPSSGLNVYIGTTAIGNGQIWSDFNKSVSLAPTEAGKYTIGFTATGSGHTYTGTIELNATSGVFEDIYVYAGAANTRTELKDTAQTVIDMAKEAMGVESVGIIQLSLLPYSIQGTLSSVYGTFYENSTSTVPASSYTGYNEESFKALSYCPTEEIGTADLTYTIYDNTGLFFVTGRICVSNKEHTSISYTTTMNNAVNFAKEDFDKAAAEALGVGYTLTGIRFTGIKNENGNIFYGSYTNPALTTADYSRSQIDSLGFKPANGFVGEAGVFYFTAKATYMTGSEAEFNGSVSVTVGEQVDVFMQVAAGKAIALSESDFAAFLAPYSKGEAQLITFDALPSSGVLYEKYAPASATGIPAAANKQYYFSTLKNLTGSEPVIKDLTFAAAANAENTTVKLPFTIYSSDNTTRSGVIQIRITKGEAAAMSGSAYCTGALMSAESIAKICTAATGGTLSYVTFTLPSANEGRLFYNYKSATSYESKVTSADKFYATGSGALLSKVAFIPVAGFSGVCSVKYTAFDTNGNWFVGTVRINVISKTASSVFSDVSGSYKWAADSIDFLYSNGVTTGVTATNYQPKNNIKRGDFVLMLYRAFDLSRYDAYAASTANFTDVKSTDYYANAIRVARYLEIAKGNGKTFSPESTITREEAMALIYRTLEKVDWTLSRESDTAYSSFKDTASVSSYAVSCMQYFVKTGVVVGSGGKLNPKAAISRAEMAVTLHRVLTY
ncbi:MAG: S-layer homology domain-containing protein [Oscillospiraceae bacterium]|nr:S-layer homology domain-containing protein [Oscillospiraceae bacterium]